VSFEFCVRPWLEIIFKIIKLNSENIELWLELGLYSYTRVVRQFFLKLVEEGLVLR
jgi:hypothetical protein